mmetsp:Transcript_9703/g.14459  ORF Transcript_9703/g.14459 Transcript_9703/m.14459 type:complete len:191 (+) Transcript_9703:653-1225(+)
MADLQEAFLGDTLIKSSRGESLGYALTQKYCVVIKYSERLEQFDFEPAISQIKEFTKSKITQETLDEHLNRINNPKNLTPPPKWIVFVLSLVVIMVLFAVVTLFIFIWTLMVLDLVIGAVELYLLKRLIILLWVKRKQCIDKKNFPGLRKCLQELNNYYAHNKVNLKWILVPNGKVLQLSESGNNPYLFS